MTKSPILPIFVVAAVLLGVCAPLAHAQLAPISVEIATTESGSELLKFQSNEPIAVIKSFSLDKPNRVVIDIAKVSTGDVKLPKDYDGRLVRAIRFGQFDARTSRIVLDVNGPAKVVNTTSGNPFSVEILATGPIKQSPKAIVEKAKPLIVIDAGHGGQDPGAKGLHGTWEKDVTLNYARAMKEALLNTGRYRVALTRDNDIFVVLPDRVAIARKLKADIFISFHADSNPRPEARGLSIYTLSETASDDEAAALAEHENKADILPGIDLRGADADVASILIDLTQRETMNKSAVFADAVVDSLNGRITKLQKVHRFAGFRVLKAPDIPSVLIELGFLSNEVDERLLLTPEYRDLVVNSVVKGIDRFHAGE
ncbi:MAG: N-acetylmuramoyl-L-alanine amidase [Rickettsiales bacterium]